MTCQYPVITQRGSPVATQITITGNTIRLVAEGDITQDEWVDLLIQYDLHGRPMRVLDYQMSDFASGDTVVHQWMMQVEAADTTLRVAP